MAVTQAAATLTEAHRLAQARLGAATVAQMSTLWPLLDPTDLDTTFARWLQAVTPVVQANRQASATLAANYYRTFRALEVGLDTFTPVLAPPVAANPLTGALVISGPASIKRALGRGVELAKALNTAEAMSGAVAQYHALNGGRETITASTAADPRARGWARSTSGRPCAFCSALASRGFVYSEETVGFEAHPGCGCGAEPTFVSGAESQLPPGTQEARDRWNETTQGLSGKEALNAFRRSMA